MSDFPTLKTGAKWQYPTTKLIEFQTTVLKFVDGSEQRYRETQGPLRQWNAVLHLLDEEELQRLEVLFEANQGAYGRFTFEDPWNETESVNCSFADDQLELELQGESRGQSVVRIKENRV